MLCYFSHHCCYGFALLVLCLCMWQFDSCIVNVKLINEFPELTEEHIIYKIWAYIWTYDLLWFRGKCTRISWTYWQFV